eukprot:TRINITY_DN3586_c0_g1_i1.p1 TRINITY_DN3586_c0_g1~~TRINITY_DN3586_c0_g1_i1.p1  ORF type:complete len:258 (-),score=76.26 TRINITY_DN3586_c0_g1_i1:1211-1984(-)
MAPAMELLNVDLKAMRAAQYRRNLKEKRSAYARLLDVKESRRSEREQLKAAEWPPARLRSQVVAPARPPHGAGRAAARTLLSRGEVEAVGDMPSIVAGCNGREAGNGVRKARVAPQLKTSPALRIQDVEDLTALLNLPVKKLLDEQSADFNASVELHAMREILALEARAAKEMCSAEVSCSVEDISDQIRAMKEGKDADAHISVSELQSIEEMLLCRAKTLLGEDLSEEDWQLLPTAEGKTVDSTANLEDDSWAILA